MPEPLDLNDIELKFTWLPAGIVLTVNGKQTMTVPSDTPNYPTLPMNLIINAGLGLDWKPVAGNFNDFIVKKAEYDPA